MGFELCRFEGDVDEELLCPVCGGVLDAPVQAPACEHTYCAGCIEHWLQLNQTCPMDRLPLTADQLGPAPRILRNLLGRLRVACEFAGCPARLALGGLAQHASQCEFNPKRLVSCQLGCGLVLPWDQLGEHNCIRALRDLIEEQQAVVAELRCEHSELRSLVDDLRRELHQLQRHQPPPPQPPYQSASDDVIADMEAAALAWARGLPLARVTRWGGVISTPDAGLQAAVRRSLADTGCPQRLLADLMERAHERHWPPGVASLELRQANRRQYDSYVIRRLPGSKQAALLLACENRHMPPELMLEPGVLMVFAHGVD